MKIQAPINMQYFVAASNEFQFPSPKVNTWIINDDVSFCRSAKSGVWLNETLIPQKLVFEEWTYSPIWADWFLTSQMHE